MRARAVFLLAGALVVFRAAPAQTVTTMVNNGDPANRIDLAIVSEGYTASQSSQFAADVNTLMGAFFANEVFRDYAPYFNVRAVSVASNQSGAGNGAPKDTAFGAYYNCDGIERLICVDYSKVTAVVNPLLPANQRDYVIVLVNDAEYGGAGGSLVVASTNSEVIEIVLHEFGHTLGLLADEYDYSPPPCEPGEPAAVNVTRETQRGRIKWSAWIDAATPLPTLTTTPANPGLYEGADYCPTGMFRPTYNSRMRNLGVPYEQVNDEQLVRRLYNLVSAVDSYSPASSLLEPAPGAKVDFSVTPLAPVSHSLTTSWLVDGAAAGSGASFTLDTGPMSGGVHTVQAIVQDVTSWVRTDPLGLLRDAQTWPVRVTALPLAVAMATPPPDGMEGRRYGISLSAQGGAAPYKWAVASGALPLGLALSSSGRISGVPRHAGTSIFSVQVTDALSAKAAQTLTVTILSSPFPTRPPLRR